MVHRSTHGLEWSRSVPGSPFVALVPLSPANFSLRLQCCVSVHSLCSYWHMGLLYPLRSCELAIPSSDQSFTHSWFKRHLKSGGHQLYLQIGSQGRHPCLFPCWRSGLWHAAKSEDNWDLFWMESVKYPVVTVFLVGPIKFVGLHRKPLESWMWVFLNLSMYLACSSPLYTGNGAWRCHHCNGGVLVWTLSCSHDHLHSSAALFWLVIELKMT